MSRPKREYAAKRAATDIFQHTRYRTYFRSVYEELKREEKGFSIRSFQRSAGFSDRSNHFWQVINGTVRLSLTAADRYARALGLTKEEKGHLHAMIALEKAKTEEERERIIRAMIASSRFLSENRYLTAALLLFSDWKLPILWEVVALDTFREDPSWIAKNFFTGIAPAAVREGLDKLLAHGFISRDRQGKLRPERINLSDYVAAAREKNDELVTIRKAQTRNGMTKALEALDSQPFEKRLFYGMSFAVSKELYEEMKQRVIALQEELRLIAAKRPVRDAVYQLNVQFFAPFSS